MAIKYGRPIESRVRVVPADQDRIVVVPSTHPKCERCWHYHPSVGSIADHPGLCERCDNNLHGHGETRSFA